MNSFFFTGLIGSLPGYFIPYLEFGSKKVLEGGIFIPAPKIQQVVPRFHFGTYSLKVSDPRPKIPRALCWGTFFFWLLHQVTSGFGDPGGSYTTADIAPSFLWTSNFPARPYVVIREGGIQYGILWATRLQWVFVVNFQIYQPKGEVSLTYVLYKRTTILLVFILNISYISLFFILVYNKFLFLSVATTFRRNRLPALHDRTEEHKEIHCC